MYTFEAKIMIQGVQGQIVERVNADSTTQARQIIQAKYSGQKIISWVGPTQVR
jgi:hypothetical protein